MCSHGQIQPTRHVKHAGIVLRVALGVRQAANAVWKLHCIGQHGIKHTTAPPGFLGRGVRLLLINILVAYDAHNPQYK